MNEGKMIVMITCSIHATEVASTHTAVEFAYRLLTEDNNPKFKAILDNVILLLEPSQNPDGVDIVTKWYRKTRGTPYDGTSPPELYHHYVGHDDNRDWYIFTQPETRNTAPARKHVASARSFTTCTRWARTRRAFSFHRGWIRWIRISIRFWRASAT